MLSGFELYPRWVPLYAHKTHYLTEIPEINNYNSIYYNFNLRVKTKSKSDFKGNVMGCSDQILSPEPNFTRRIKLNLLGSNLSQNKLR